ncbi:MAG: gliding motility-associated C-terminal domain-containing protein [Bacteroidetes bacterium]|nr:gliding motility-associated C-terminal domain-containing protein [Bacteroidota bacterium]
MPPVNLCGPTVYQVCTEFFQSSGFYTVVCQSYQGCDSTVNVNLTILEPQANISPPDQIGCGADSLVYLDGTSSPFALPPQTTSFQWTGPGIIGQTNQVLALVNEPGTYCLTVTHGSGSFTCTAESCVTVTENIIIPSAPAITGPTTVCSGAMSTYTANLQGPVIPDNLTWITPNGEPFTVGPNNTITVNWTGSSGGQLCVTANNECGSSPPACINVTVNGVPAAPQVSGPVSVCAGSTPQTYTIGNALPGITYNWTVPAGATFTGSGSSINVNFSGVTPGNVQVCATAQNNCGTSAAGCANMTVTGPPTTPVMAGPANVCANGGAATFTVTNVQAGVTYTWSAPPGAVVTGSGASVTIDFSAGNSGQVCVTATNNCGNPSVCQAVTVAPAPTVGISGSGEFCNGTTPSIPLTLTLTGNAPWTVIYVNGGNQDTISVPSSPHTFNVAAAGTYTIVSVVGANGCTGTGSGSAVVTQNPLPTATLSGGGDICAGSGQTVPLTITLTGEAPWVVDWTVNGIAQTPLNINASPFPLPIGESLAGDIDLVNVVDGNTCDGNVSGTSLVQVFDAPTVSNVQTQCDPTNTSFTVTFTISSGDAASYSVTPAGTLAGNQFTSNSIPQGSGYSFVVTDVNDCNPVTVADPIVVCNCATSAGDMDANTIEFCGAGTVTGIYDDTNEALDGNDVVVYYLHSGSSVNIVPPVISISGTPDVTFNAGTMSFGTTYYLSAVVGDSDGAGGVNINDPCLDVAQGTPIVFYEIPTATLAGSTDICIGESTDLTLTLTGAAPWDVTINGLPISVFSSPFTYTVTPGTTTTYLLTNVSDDNNCSNTASGSETVTVNTPPTVANIVTTCDPTGTTFTVCFDIIGGDPACYSVTPANGTLTGSQFCSNPIADGLGYNFTVTDCNGCTPVILDEPLVDCSCLSTAGNFPSTPLSICGTDVAQLVYDPAGEFLDADDALCFILHSGNPSNPIATSPTAQFTFQPGMNYDQTYFICPVVGNDDGSGCVDFGDPCLSIGNCAPVVFHEVPAASIGPDVSICEGTNATLTIDVTGGVAPWTVSYQDGAGNIFPLTIPTSPFTFTVTPTASTNYTLVSLNGQFCAGTISGQANVTVNQPPTVQNIVETCSPDATSYVLTFDIVGGALGTYTVVPAIGIVNNGSFTSPAIPNGQVYNFDVDDVNACGPANVTGSENCLCLTDAGTMGTNPVEFCVDENGIVNVTVDSFLDPNDVLVYYLHTGSSGMLGTVIATNSTPNFTFDPGTMTVGTTYYVSAVAGNDNGSGGVDLLDGCLDVAPGTPIVFNALPTVAISGTATICQGQSTNVTFTLTGQGPFVVNYTVNGAPQTQNIPTAGNFTLPVSPTASQTLTLVSVTDQNCDNVSAQSITITVNPNVDAGTVIGNFEFCQSESQVIDLNTQLSGATPGGTWTGPNGEIVPGGTFNVAGLGSGTQPYTYSVPGLPPCPNDSAVVDVIINPLPTADAGTDVELNCDLTETPIGGTGNTPGVTFNWTGTGTLTNPTSASPTASDPGTYVLVVTTPQGCTDSDEMTVTEDVTPSVPHITVSDVSCFGDTDGFITIDSITGGQPPYLCSFNGSPFSAQKSFTNLSPGQHTIVVVDASGCETTLIFTVAEPQEVTVDIEGNFEGNDPVVELGDPITLQIITTPPFNLLDTVVWSPADLVDCDTCQSNEVYLTLQTTFTVMVDKDGCRDEDLITVFVKKNHPIYVPSAFSPNGDLINDFLLVYGGKEVVSIKSFLVFSRWGETVYEYYNFLPNNPDFGGWNGEHRGEKLNPAVFTWFAEVEFIDGKVELFEGHVNLIK